MFSYQQQQIKYKTKNYWRFFLRTIFSKKETSVPKPCVKTKLGHWGIFAINVLYTKQLKLLSKLKAHIGNQCSNGKILTN